MFGRLIPPRKSTLSVVGDAGNAQQSNPSQPPSLCSVHPHSLLVFGLSVFLVSRRICPPQVPPDYLHARFTVQPHGSMTLYGRRDLPLVEARMVASATAELREDASMVSCRL